MSLIKPRGSELFHWKQTCENSSKKWPRVSRCQTCSHRSAGVFYSGKRNADQRRQWPLTVCNVWFSLKRRQSKHKSSLKTYQDQYGTAHFICLYFSVIQTINRKAHKFSWLREQTQCKKDSWRHGLGGSGEEWEITVSSVTRHGFQELKEKIMPKV